MAAVLDTPWSGQTFAPPTPLDITTLENAIVTQLQSQIDAIEVAHFPDKPESYRLVHRVGAALVRYQGAKYGGMFDITAVVQKRLLEFEITLMMRDLGWSYGGEPGGTSPGAYAMLEAVRAALTGFQIPGCTKMYPVKERFVERDRQGGVWVYAISFELATAAVEPSTANNFPLFVKGVVQEQGGLTTTTVAPAPYTFNSAGQIQLPHGNVSSVEVSNPATGNVYADGPDYTVDPVNGIITIAASGALTSGATVDVAYSYAETTTASANAGIAPINSNG